MPVNFPPAEMNVLLLYDLNPHWTPSEKEGVAGTIGGMKLYAKKGRIVCSQTIDDRIDLCFQAAIPAIRYMLFPSMRKGAE